MTEEQKQIYLLVETSRQFGRSILRGIIRWSHQYGPFRLRVSAGHLPQELPKLDRGRASGFIARVSVPGLANLVRRYRVPTILLEPNTRDQKALQEELGLGAIRINSEATGKMGADYFFDHGFESFAFCGFGNRIWSDQRQAAFVEAVRSRGFSCSCYEPPTRESAWPGDRQRLRKWIKSLPQPIGMMACDDDRARQVLDLCEEEGMEVPSGISVLGAADDELLCELASVPLSSIAFDLEKAGFEAMVQLSGLMDGSITEPYNIEINPLWITPRISTDYMAQKDKLVVRALRFIRSNYLRPIAVADIVENLGVSRRTLEKRFFTATGHSLMEDINLRRYRRAKQLLLTTNDPITKVCIESGFVSYRSMLGVFVAELGYTPHEFKVRHGRSRDDENEHL